MARRVVTPPTEDILAAYEAFVEQGHLPSVLQLSQQLGISNSTFWRRYPELAQVIVQNRRSGFPHTSSEPSASTSVSNPDNSGVYSQLRRQLELALAQVQVLSIENADLRKENLQLRGLSVLRGLAEPPGAG